MKEKKPKIVLLDDEERIVRSVKALLRNQYKVKATTDPQEALEYIKEHEVMAIISDQRMPEMTGVEMLRKVKELSPGTMRLLLTGYADKEAVIDSVNHGEIYRYINKPWDADTLKAVVAEAVDVAQRTFHAAKLSESDLEKDSVKPVILTVDSGEETHNLVKDSLNQEECTFLHAFTIEECYKMLAEQDVDIFVSDTRFSNTDMMSIIKMLKANYPELITVVTTNYSDSNALISLINEGQVFRFLLKPISKVMLNRALNSAIKRVKQNRLNPELLERHRVEVTPTVKKDTAKEKNSSLLSRLRARRAQRAARASL